MEICKRSVKRSLITTNFVYIVKQFFILDRLYFTADKDNRKLMKRPNRLYYLPNWFVLIIQFNKPSISLLVR